MAGFKINNSLPIDKSAQQTMEQQKKHLETRMRGAAQMYEKMFIREMVQAMRKTVQHSEISKPTMAERIYQDKMYDNYIDQWSKQDNLGLSKVIYEQMLEKFSPYHRNNIAPPSGPLPLERSKLHSVPKEGSQIKPLEGAAAQPATQSWLLSPGEGDRDVTSPWKGEVVGVVNGLENRKLVRIEHPDGLVSQLGFVGNLKGIQLGDSVDAGQVLGRLEAGQNLLNWTVNAG